MPLDWVKRPDTWVYTPTFVMDGNFSGNHLSSRIPENNVEIASGTGYFPTPIEYAQYLKRADDDDVRT